MQFGTQNISLALESPREWTSQYFIFCNLTACAPFAILVADEVHRRANVDVIFLWTDRHGATIIIDTDGSNYLIDSSLGTAHMLKQYTWYYKCIENRMPLLLVPPLLPHNESELVYCESLHLSPTFNFHSSIGTSHVDASHSQHLNLQCYEKRFLKPMAFKVVLQEKLLEWSLQDTIKQSIIVFLGHTQSNHQNIFAHYLRVNLKTAKVTLPFKDYLSMFTQEDSKHLIGMTQ